MPSLDNNDVIFLFSIAIVLALLLIIVSLWRGNRLLRDFLKSAKPTDTSSGESKEAMDKLGNKMDSVSQEINDIKSQIVDKPVYEGESDAYLQAINAARAGADALELESRFGMSASEAELLVSVHGQKQTRAD